MSHVAELKIKLTLTLTLRNIQKKRMSNKMQVKKDGTRKITRHLYLKRHLNPFSYIVLLNHFSFNNGDQTIMCLVAMKNC